MSHFNVETTRRLSIGLLAVSGSLLFAALNLVGSGVSANNIIFAESASKSITPLFYSASFSLIALIFSEIAEHPSTPKQGHPHSRLNYLQSAFVFIALNGLGGLAVGAFLILRAATNLSP